MDYLFYQVAAINGFDSYGHYLRAGLILNTCSQYAIASSPDCLATFGNRQRAQRARRERRARPGLRRHAPLALAAPARRLLPRQDAAADLAAATRRAPKRRRSGARRRPRPPPPRRRAAPQRRPRRPRADATPAQPAADRVGAARLPAGERADARRGSASIAANPVLIGAATTLVVIVAVFLAYNANSGLPFVPTYELKTQVPNAANLVKGNDVRIGGTRVGAVTDITPVTATGRLGHRRAHAQARDHRQAAAGRLDRAHPPALGAGPEVRRDHEGHVERGLRRTARRSRCATRRPQPVEIDEVLSMFDDKTRAASQSNLTEFGNALRRPRARPQPWRSRSSTRCCVNLVPVMQNLVGPAHARSRAWSARWGGPPPIVAPAAETQAALFGNLDTTFRALANVARPFLQDSISGGPPALDAAIKDFPQQRPFLANSAALFRELRPGVARAVDGGAGPRRRARDRHADAAALGGVQQAASSRPSRRSSASPTTRWSPSASRTSTSTVTILAPTIAHLTPVQTVCNYATLWFRNVVQPAQRRRQQRHQPALHHHRHAAGAQQRGRPVVGARQRRRPGRAGQLPAHQPVPEHRLAGPAEGVRGRQRALPRRQAGHRQRARATRPPRPRRRSGSADARPSHDPTRSACRARTAPARARSWSALVVLVVVVHRRLLRLHQARPVHARLPRQGGLPVGRTRSARTRRCASPASTSARSRRSRASPAATPPS